MEKDSDRQLRQLQDSNQILDNIKTDISEMTDLRAWPQLEYVLNENSLIEDIFHRNSNLLSQEHLECTTASVKCLISRIVETLASVTSILFMERKEAEKAVRDCTEMLQCHEDEVARILGLYEKKISKAFKKLSKISAQVQEAREVTENQFVEDHDKIKTHVKQLEVLPEKQIVKFFAL